MRPSVLRAGIMCLQAGIAALHTLSDLYGLPAAGLRVIGRRGGWYFQFYRACPIAKARMTGFYRMAVSCRHSVVPAFSFYLEAGMALWIKQKRKESAYEA